ncbi:MAG TPA: hypothetical protein VHM19_08535, partial [Polyangiales bacterium]|nr:hypothetical protein [Polyangiales bacterium]
CPGKCTQRGKAGADCDRDDACRSGLHCGALGTCEKPASEGETCGGGSAPGCALGLSCQGEDAAKHITGKCVTLDTVLHAKVGESCDLAAGKLCAPDLSCAIKPNTIPVAFECMKKVASAAKCQYGIPSQCPDNEYCDADLAKLKTDGVCRKLPVSGEACLADMPGFPRCAPQLLCSTEEKCRKVGRLGDACGDDSECASTHCDKDKCAAETCK